MTARRTMRIDSHGTVRSGPADAWWIWLQERPSRSCLAVGCWPTTSIGVGYLLGGGVLSRTTTAYSSGTCLAIALLSVRLGIVGGVLFIRRHLSRQEALDSFRTGRRQPSRQLPRQVGGQLPGCP
jgi:hypothetical protein